LLGVRHNSLFLSPLSSLLSPLSLYSPLVIDVSVRFFKEREMERGLKSGLSPSPPELNF
jgi:hypothetical protein